MKSMKSPNKIYQNYYVLNTILISLYKCFLLYNGVTVIFSSHYQWLSNGEIVLNGINLKLDKFYWIIGCVII